MMAAASEKDREGYVNTAGGMNIQKGTEKAEK